jgi:flagellar biosynthetic protein FlhB
MLNDHEQRTERATPRRRREARREGKVALSGDLVAALTLLAALLALRWSGGAAVEGLREGVGGLLRTAPEPFSGAGVVSLTASCMILAATIVAPIGLVVALAAAGSSLAQTGFLWRPQAVVPSLNRLSAGRGLARALSIRGLGRGFFALLKCALLVLFLAWGLGPLVAEAGSLSPAALMTTSLPASLARGVDHILDVGTAAASALVLLGVLEWIFQRWQLERDLRMTHREVLEEQEREEGDRQIKGRRRALSRNILDGVRRRETGDLWGRGGAR